jgi:hypothetical protein
MREAARALDDVSDHLGEVLRHADELLAEWGRFGAQVRAQVEREAGTIGAVVDGAVERAAGAGIDRAIADRLRGLGAEIERIEQRARAAARAVSEQREADRRVLWIVVAGVVLANALLVMLLLRRPEPVRVPEPIRVEAIAPAAAAPAAGSAEAGSVEPAPGTDGSKAGAAAGSGTSATEGAGAAAGSASVASPGADAGSGSNASGAKAAGKPAAATKPASPQGAAGDGSGSARPVASPIALPQKPGAARVHKKLP